MPLTRAYLALGSNLGDRLENLRSALSLLEAQGRVLVLRASPIYENRAIGMGEAEPFLNAVVETFTDLEAPALLEACQGVEERLGRVRTGVWAPRTIDIDILLHGETDCATESLTIPHPGIAQRDFVLQPLVDLDPRIMIEGKTVETHLEDLKEVELDRFDERLWPADQVHAIAACAANGTIGRDERLPWSISEDWGVFLAKTRGGALIMGRTSFEGMMEEPSWREHAQYFVVTSRPKEVEAHGAVAVATVSEAIEKARASGRVVWICGGESVYAESFPQCAQLHLTLIEEEVPGDTRLPPWEDLFPNCVAELDSSDENFRYRFSVRTR